MDVVVYGHVALWSDGRLQPRQPVTSKVLTCSELSFQSERQYLDKRQRPLKCPVCGEDFSKPVFSGRDVEFHFWRSHTDYPALTRRESKRLVIILTSAAIILGVTMVYFGPPSFLFAIAGYVAFVGIIVLNFGRKIRNFKHRWEEQHGTLF